MSGDFEARERPNTIGKQPSHGTEEAHGARKLKLKDQTSRDPISYVAPKEQGAYRHLTTSVYKLKRLGFS